MSLTAFARTAMVQAIFTAGDVWLGLFKTNPDPDGTGGVECDWTGYARFNCPTAWTISTSGDEIRATPNDFVVFGTTVAQVDQIVGWGAWDAASSGNLLAFGAVTNETVDADNSVMLPAGQYLVVLE